MIRFLLKRIREKASGIIVFVLCAVVFAATFILYDLPAGAAIYPSAVSAVIWLAWVIVSGIKAYEKHKILSALTEALTEEMLPEAKSVDDEDYRRIIIMLREAERTRETASFAKFDEMVEYYTLWAHQIKTPIAAMRLTLQNEDTQLSRRLTAELGRIERYVEMVLAYLRLDSTTNDYVLREYDLDPIVKGAVKKFSREFIERHLSLELKPSGMRVLTDEKWLSFVLEQIISNALKYTPEGKISIYPEEPAVLCIQDTGIGIDPSDLPRIFEHGYTGNNGRTDKRASGLGLYLCGRVCKKLGHTLKVESEPGIGTVVKLGLSRKKLTAE